MSYEKYATLSIYIMNMYRLKDVETEAWTYKWENKQTKKESEGGSDCLLKNNLKCFIEGGEILTFNFL